nr:MAG TPA: hypothetical protein [Caudoviricetes sp.]
MSRTQSLRNGYLKLKTLRFHILLTLRKNFLKKLKSSIRKLSQKNAEIW